MRQLVDKFGRAINYLRISVTDRCDLRCVYCMPQEGIKLKNHEEMISYEEIVEICRTAVSLGIKKIRLTGGEPLIRRDICGLVKGIAGVRGIEDLALTTNGTKLKELAYDLKKAGLMRVNVSLDSLDPERYREITRGGDLNRALNGIDAALGAGLAPVKINVVLIEGINGDEVQNFVDFSKKRGVKLQFIRKMSLKEPKEMIEDDLCSRPPDCSKCNRIRLTADGKFKPCLFSDVEIEGRVPGIDEAIRSAVLSKPRVGYVCKKREMVQIGG